MNFTDQLEQLANSTTCPDWCEGKGCTDDCDPGVANHALRLPGHGRAEVSISSCAGVGIASDAPVVDMAMGWRNNLDSLSVRECRDAAAVLLAAADRLEQILAES